MISFQKAFSFFSRDRFQRTGFILVCVLTILAVYLIKDHKVFRLTDLKTLDYRFQLRGRTDIHKDIVLVSIGEKDLELLGRWPWPRKYHGDLIRVLNTFGVKTIGFDILFNKPDEEDPASDNCFAEALRASGNTVLPMAFGHGAKGQGDLLPSGPFMRSCCGCGFVNVSADEDGLMRRMMVISEGRPSLGLEIARRSLGVGENSTRFFPGKSLKLSLDNGGTVNIPLDPQNCMLINYAGTTKDWRWLHFTQIILAFMELQEGKKPSLDLDALKGKIVLVGSTNTGMSDIVETPFGTAAYGVELHASVINSILRNDFLRSLPPWGQEAVFFLFSLGSGLLLMRYRPFKGGLIILFGSFAFITAAYFLFSRFSFIVNIIGPLLGIVAVYLAGSAFHFVVVEKKGREVKKAFGCYVSRDVVAELVKNPDKLKLGGQTREITILFSDIRNFTTFSEQISADELGEFLNEYFTAMTSCIFEQGGTLDKFIGDAVMAFFGAPVSLEDHPEKACLSAVSMVEELERMNRKRLDQGKAPVRIGIGINTGTAKVGNFGSSDRFDYTVMGESVNLASRLEGLSKTYNATILISRHTYDRVKQVIQCRLLDRAIVKGSQKPLEIYEVFGPRESISRERIQLAASFEEALALFWQGRWQEAEDLFKELSIRYPEDGPTRVFTERVRQYRATLPPGEWDGVFRHTSK